MSHRDRERVGSKISRHINTRYLSNVQLQAIVRNNMFIRHACMIHLSTPLEPRTQEFEKALRTVRKTGTMRIRPHALTSLSLSHSNKTLPFPQVLCLFHSHCPNSKQNDPILPTPQLKSTRQTLIDSAHISFQNKNLELDGKVILPR